MQASSLMWQIISSCQRNVKTVFLSTVWKRVHEKWKVLFGVERCEYVNDENEESRRKESLSDTL